MATSTLQTKRKYNDIFLFLSGRGVRVGAAYVQKRCTTTVMLAF